MQAYPVAGLRSLPPEYHFCFHWDSRHLEVPTEKMAIQIVDEYTDSSSNFLLSESQYHGSFLIHFLSEVSSEIKYHKHHNMSAHANLTKQYYRKTLLLVSLPVQQESRHQSCGGFGVVHVTCMSLALVHLQTLTAPFCLR